MNVHSSVTGDQITEYVNGVLSGSVAGDSDICSNSLLRAVIYPDSQTSSDRVSLAYNRLGQRKWRKDQAGTIHQYEYDHLGLMKFDKRTTLAGGIDTNVQALGWTTMQNRAYHQAWQNPFFIYALTLRRQGHGKAD
ncbi:MAG TPA: hypothetical protein VGE41_11340 [Verrucomicrobiae bacterium]